MRQHGLPGRLVGGLLGVHFFAAFWCGLDSVGRCGCDYDGNFYHLQEVYALKDKKFFQGHARLAEEREKLWKTQQEAADYFGVSRVTWGQCERGNATPSGDVLAGLALSGADVLYILTGARSKHVPPTADLSPRVRALVSNYEAAPEAGKRIIEGTASLAAQSAARAKDDAA